MEYCAGFAVRWEPVVCGMWTLQIATVADLARHVDAARLLRDPAAPEPPYWAHLWPGSRALAAYLAENPEWASGRVLEAGCGLGLVAVLAARLGATSFAFDRDRHALAFSRLNAQRNQVPIHLFRADLCRLGLRTRFRLILAADVTYDPALQRALLDLAAESLEDGGRMLCAESVRTFDRAWLQEAVWRGLSVREQEREETEFGRPVRVRLIELVRPGASGE
jgi:predicted nicotinamide N-methyase